MRIAVIACCVGAVSISLAFQPPASDPKPATKPAKKPASEPPDGKDQKPAKPAKVDEPKKKFFELEKFDNVVLDAANDNAVLKVMPLDLPGRKLPPEPKRVGKLKVRLFDDRGEEYEVMWRNIDRIEFFEELVLREANKIVEDAVAASGGGKAREAEKHFDEAYDYFQYLLKFYPNTAGLQPALQSYLYLNAGSLFKEGRIFEAFAVLEELYRQNSEYTHRGGPQTVKLAMEAVGDRLVRGYVDREDFRSARILLERLGSDYGNNLKVVASWRDKLSGIAGEKRDVAKAALAKRQFRQAHDASREMLKIWPRIEGGRELVLEISRQYPLVVVGVSQPATSFDPASPDNPAARRAGHLIFRSFLEFASRGPEGGQYSFLYGTVEQSDDRKQVFFNLNNSVLNTLTAYDVSNELLNLSNPAHSDYDPAWASLMEGVRVPRVSQVSVSLRRPHVLPQALLQTRFAGGTSSDRRYRVAEKNDDEQRFEPIYEGDATAEPRPVIVEKYFGEPRTAIEALNKGKIDMLARVLPNDALRMKNDESLVVGTYDFPSLHVLIPNTEHPFLGNKTFRRALLYAINREVILHKGLLGGEQIEGCRVVSGPFPAGITKTDSSAYAYNQDIEPLPYDPVMGAILLKMTENQLAAIADQREEPAPELGELVLAHPTGEIPRFVCKQIQVQLEVIGVQVKLKELPPGQTIDPTKQYDLLLCELMMREPLVDARRVFGPGGPAESDNPYISLALRQLDTAANWKEIRERLHEMHRLMFDQVNVLPLWQMVDHFVYQRGLRNVNDRPIYLYNNVEQWRVIPQEFEE